MGSFHRQQEKVLARQASLINIKNPLLLVSLISLDCSVDTMASYGQLLTVPSYDDATLFDQVDIAPSSSKSQESPDEQITLRTHIHVDDPVKRTEQTIIPGMSGGYVMYRVSTTTSLPTYAQKSFSVRRRFRDVVVGASPHCSLLAMQYDDLQIIASSWGRVLQ